MKEEREEIEASALTFICQGFFSPLKGNNIGEVFL